MKELSNQMLTQVTGGGNAGMATGIFVGGVLSTMVFYPLIGFGKIGAITGQPLCDITLYACGPAVIGAIIGFAYDTLISS